jgi:hypothetical protein
MMVAWICYSTLIEETGIDAADTQACLKGETAEGKSIEGCDSISTLP